MTDFSFVSVELGISFAPSQNALTIYNCPAAHRYIIMYTSRVDDLFSCVECLNTSGACGWCLYGGVCSGTSDPCPVPTGVNNHYLTVQEVKITTVT